MKTRAVGLVALVASCTAPQTTTPTDTDTGSDTPRPFTRISDDPPADVTADRLCTLPDPDAPDFDPLDLDCAHESMRYADPDLAPPSGPLTVMAFNIERGLQLDGILAAFDTGDLPIPDVFLVSELDRGCSRTQGRDVTRELAEHLQLDGVFGVEFIELPRGSGAGGSITSICEHGNAILSRYPLGNARVAFHESNVDWYTPPEEADGGEPRFGGRSFVVADAQVGDQLLRLVSIHFESRPTAWDGIHEAQATESAEAGLEVDGPAIVGGDTNFPFYSFDLARDDGTLNDPGAAALLDRGYVDAHAALPVEDRGTSSGLIIDLIFGVDVSFRDPAVCPTDLCDPLSDHEAVWADVTWPALEGDRTARP